jgi:hypothetical protein
VIGKGNGLPLIYADDREPSSFLTAKDAKGAMDGLAKLFRANTMIARI